LKISDPKISFNFFGLFGMDIPKPVVLIVLDGWGIAPPGPGNAVSLANPIFFRKLWLSNAHTTLLASGEAVGLTHNEAGNSEVGHLNLGAGYIVYQDLLRISRAIADGSFFENKAFLRAIEHVKNHHSNLHLIGLIGPSGVHSSIEHLYALLRLAREQDLKNVFVHAFTDGRDSPPTSAQIYLAELSEKMQSLGVGKFASVVGRYFAMDRDLRWERTKSAYELLTEGKGEIASSALNAVSSAYQRGETDEFIRPRKILSAEEDFTPISDHDGVIFFNFRTDRPRQLTSAFVQPAFTQFKRNIHPTDLFFVTMTRYEKGLPVSAVAFEPFYVDLPLARVLSEKNLRQLHIAESEKFPHVTYFFNGGREDPFPGEDRIEIPSPKVPTYDLKPEMSAEPVTEVLIERIKQNLYDFILVNYANADMVGHTGKIEAGKKAVLAVDNCLAQLVPEVLGIGGIALITADHGNIEIMINAETGGADTEHNQSPAPFIFVKKRPDPRELPQGILADISPTILGLLNIPIPSTMTARNLLG